MRRDDRTARLESSAGFTLMEMALVLVIAGVIYGIWSSVVPWINEDLKFQRTRLVMAGVDQAMLSFARTNSRLPCPDTSAPPNGLEGSGAAAGCQAGDVVGQVPFESLKMAARADDAHHAAITYALFRDASDDADLGVLTNRVESMNDFDGSNIPTSVENILDFCQALRSASTTKGAGWASTSTLLTAGGCAAGSVLNQAYVLASSGQDDADGDTDRFDGENVAAPATCFASPQQGRSAEYDDVVTSVGFGTLLGELCRVLR